jgi:hypothetical protein
MSSYRGWTIRVPRRLSKGAIEAAQRDGCRRAAEDLSATALLRAAEITTKNTTIFVEGSREAVERFAGALQKRARGARPTLARVSAERMRRAC